LVGLACPEAREVFCAVWGKGAFDGMDRGGFLEEPVDLVLAYPVEGSGFPLAPEGPLTVRV